MPSTDDGTASSYGLYSYGLASIYGLYSYGLASSYGLYSYRLASSYGLYSYHLCRSGLGSYGLYSYGQHRTNTELGYRKRLQPMHPCAYMAIAIFFRC